MSNTITITGVAGNNQTIGGWNTPSFDLLAAYEPGDLRKTASIFQVLMYWQDPAAGTNKVVESFKISAIRSKFVIDKHGNIRFHFTGFSGGDDAAVEEISAMIELAKIASTYN